MLAATALVRGLAVNVRIRNISETGALLEADVLPEVGSVLMLQRSQHEAIAEVVWAKAGRCGVRFQEPIIVSEWAGVQAAAVPSASSEMPPLPSSLMPKGTPEQDRAARLPQRVGEELAYVQRLVESIGNELVANPVFVNRYQHSLQNFDLATQILGHLSRVLMADDRVAAAERVGMQELKKRLLRS